MRARCVCVMCIDHFRSDWLAKIVFVFARAATISAARTALFNIVVLTKEMCNYISWSTINKMNFESVLRRSVCVRIECT